MKKFSVILLIIALLFVSCKGKQEETVSTTQTKTVYTPKGQTPDEEYVEICGTPVLMREGYVFEPDSNLDIFNMSFSDFGSFFTENYPVSVTTYNIAVGEPTETTVYHIHSDNEGPTVYISGGIHGNEKAAWYTGVLMKDATIKCGDLYVICQTNIVGANNNTRGVDSDDPNRFFPGDPEGSITERLVYAVYTDIEDKNPDLLLDLHEAILYTDSRDFLGSTYIFTDLTGIEDLFFDLLCATEEGEICHNEFGFTGPGPAGSMNQTVTTNLHIPSLTIETFRGFDIYRRVYDQLDTIQFILNYKGMI